MLYAVETFGAALLILVVFFQIFVPLIEGTPLFPAFRKKKAAVVNKLMEAQEDIEIATIARAAVILEKRAEKLRQSIPKEEAGANTNNAGPPKPDAH